LQEVYYFYNLGSGDMKLIAKINTTGMLFLSLITTAFAHSDISQTSQASTKEPDGVLFKNVQIFDGKSNKLTAPMNVLVRGNKIQSISSPIQTTNDTIVIEANQKVLMPGLIDAH
jgi:adenine deaminase